MNNDNNNNNNNNDNNDNNNNNDKVRTYLPTIGTTANSLGGKTRYKLAAPSCHKICDVEVDDITEEKYFLNLRNQIIIISRVRQIK